MFIPLMRFLLRFGFEKFSPSFEILFSYFSFISACLIISASYIYKYLWFSISVSVLIAFCCFFFFRAFYKLMEVAVFLQIYFCHFPSGVRRVKTITTDTFALAKLPS